MKHPWTTVAGWGVLLGAAGKIITDATAGGGFDVWTAIVGVAGFLGLFKTVDGKKK